LWLCKFALLICTSCPSVSFQNPYPREPVNLSYFVLHERALKVGDDAKVSNQSQSPLPSPVFFPRSFSPLFSLLLSLPNLVGLVCVPQGIVGVSKSLESVRSGRTESSLCLSIVLIFLFGSRTPRFSQRHASVGFCPCLNGVQIWCDSKSFEGWSD